MFNHVARVLEGCFLVGGISGGVSGISEKWGLASGNKSLDMCLLQYEVKKKKRLLPCALCSNALHFLKPQQHTFFSSLCYFLIYFVTETQV